MEEPSVGQSAHQEAVEFVEKHRALLEQYARGRIKIEPAPPGLDTFAFNLENNIIYVNSKFYKGFGLPEEGTYFATLHELEHFFEKKQILSEKGGEKIFARYLERLKKSQAYSLMDNHIADVRENTAVETNSNKDLADIEDRLYKEVLLKDGFANEPRHVQFCYAMHELRNLNDTYEVAPEVRQKLDELKAITAEDGTRLVDIMCHPETPMSLRLKLQDRYVWPMVQELLDKDLEDEKNKPSSAPKDGAAAGEDKKDGDKGGENKEEKDGNGEEEKANPNEVFKDTYNRAAKRVPNAVPIEKIEEALKEWKEFQDANSPATALKKYAESIGVKKEDLQMYRKIVKGLESKINPETGENIVEELRKLIRRIISKRLKPNIVPRYPLEEGEELVDPAGVLSEARRGNLQPKVWESVEIKQKLGKKHGEIEITLVCDRSGSMEQDMKKLDEQRKAAVFMMEALKEFADLADAERVNMDEPLEVRSEIYTFQQSDEDDKPLKKMGKELGEKERIEVMKKISTAPGNRTTDFIPLETIDKNLNEDNLRKITEGELKKIVVVFTDGESHGVQRVKDVLEKLRSKGVIVIGVGITEGGKAALITYAPDARLAEQAEKLSFVLADVLKDNLADV